jgi:DNA helicase-2/ATP-dependent DNA helicase PcrA
MNILEQLNSSQGTAVQHFCGPLLVVAGAGSGKTRALTYRIAYLIRHYKVAPENILAVTFTNKAAKEMKSRLENIFAQEIALNSYNQRLELLPEYEQKQIKSKVYRGVIKNLWIGTFHSLLAKILRFDIDKYQDDGNRTWKKSFSIFDESDAQSLVKNIVTKRLNLDDKKFEPRKIRYEISNIKNRGMSPEDYLLFADNYKEKVIAEVYQQYQNNLATNNALDFDDLLLTTVKLFEQNESILGYWHTKFKHILVDEYQDTNQIQYQLIRLLTTNNEPIPPKGKGRLNWENRSLFVVGDADQSIYSFRLADFTILLNFQKDFGDGLPDDDTRTMIKLEENYRSRENILEAANKLIKNNSQRIEKTLIATRGSGEQIYLYKADDERDEAYFIVKQIKLLMRENPELNYGNFAVLYRTNAQSRAIEEELIKTDINYNIIGGMKFYERKEIKDAIAYLRIVANPDDTVSLLRIINTPARGIGKKTIDSLITASQELNIPLWEIISDETSVNTLAGRAAKSINNFVEMMKFCQKKVTKMPAIDILKYILDKSEYLQELKEKGTDEAENRLENINELYNAVLQISEDNDDYSLENFLSSASLSSDTDDLKEGDQRVSLMTLHSAKGLEFPIVFMVGLEQGLLPHGRSLNDPLSLEEERRLCYVGITRAQEQLFLSFATERFIWGSREMTVMSQFVNELPEDLINTNLTKRKTNKKSGFSDKSHTLKSAWEVGDHVLHNVFGEGEITHVFGEGNKINVAIKFEIGRKIINPQIAPMRKI